MRGRRIQRMLAAGLAGLLLFTGCGSTQQAADAAQSKTETTPDAATETSLEVPEPVAESKNVYDPATFDPEEIFAAPTHTAMDISGCDTFTQIVDKLPDGKGYTNITMGDTDVLLVATDLYEWEHGHIASLDAEVYAYKDGTPVYLGYVAAGGTAYPLQIKDGILYAGGNHYMRKYTVRDNTLLIMEEVYVSYDTEGNDTFYYRTEGTAFADHAADTAKEQFDAAFRELDRTEVIFFDKIGAAGEGVLPAYEYPGPEAFYFVLYRYLIDELSPNYAAAQVSIPCPVIVAVDDSDRQDIRVYGSFWLFNYDLNGDILENTSGGSYPGCIHLKQVDSADGYEVTKMEVTEDGSGFTESAKRIFGKYYDEFSKLNADDKKREEIRAQIIANYVAANNLSIKAYKDYGWDAVELPAENIDSFYSQLD